MSKPNKRKVINDPVHGFITISDELLFEVIEHRYFQRLRRIRQTGLSDLVYPGAVHTRFHHALGAMHLMGEAIEGLRFKGIEISDDEKVASQAAILMHDLGHGPFSHVLEDTLLDGVGHEVISELLMEQMNRELNGKLQLAIDIFNGNYKRKFFSQLIAGQLDIDRLDYLRRDSFFTGVNEGDVAASRLLKMLDVRNDSLVFEEKAIYSIENFLVSRRIMYWQVYLHKTCLSAEIMLKKTLQRVRHLIAQGQAVNIPQTLDTFFGHKAINIDSLLHLEILERFAAIDDHDIWYALKIWRNHRDPILQVLTNGLLERKLFRLEIASQPMDTKRIEAIKNSVISTFNLEKQLGDEKFLFDHNIIQNKAYANNSEKISILTKKNEIVHIEEASDLENIKAMSKIVKKVYYCYPKYLTLQEYSDNSVPLIKT